MQCFCIFTQSRSITECVSINRENINGLLVFHVTVWTMYNRGVRIKIGREGEKSNDSEEIHRPEVKRVSSIVISRKSCWDNGIYR